MIESIFKNVLIMSFVGTFLSIVLFALKPLTKKFFGFSWQYYIWYAVLGVMLLPLSVSVVTNSGALSVNISEGYNDAFYESDSIVMQDFSGAESQTNKNNVFKTEFDWFKSIAYIWFIYANLIFVSKLAHYFIYLQIVRRKSIKLKKEGNVQIWYTSLVSAPLTVGIFRKKILIPQRIDNQKYIEHILLHENTHIKHGDIFFKWIIMLAKCIHWFNPVVYIISKETERLCEIVCDIDSTRNMDDAQKKSYMNTILSLVSASIGTTSELTTHMADSKSRITERFSAIVSFQNRKKMVKCMSALLAVITAVVSFGISALAGGLFCEDSPFNLKLSLLSSRDEDLSASVSDNIEDVSLNELSDDRNYENVFQDTGDDVYSEEYMPEQVSKPAVYHAADFIPENENEKAINNGQSSTDVSQIPAKVPSESAVWEDVEPSYDKYPYSGQIKYDGLTFERITSEIDLNGGTKLYSDNSGVDDGYIPGKLTYKNDGIANHDNIKCDENGQIMFYMDSEYDQHVNIVFNQNGKQIAGYGIIPDNETTYVFGGFNPEEEYDIEISTSTGSTWMIESDYLLY